MSKFNVLSQTEVKWIEGLLGLSSEDLLGSGYYARVYKTKNNTALKITVDQTYMEFVKLAESSDNPMFPKILNNFGCIGKFAENNFPVYAVEMPLYKSVYERLCGGRCSSDLYNDLDSIADDFKHLMGGGIVSFRKDLCLNPHNPVIEFCNKSLVDFTTFMDAINELIGVFGKNKQAWFDMHIGNFMYDGDQIKFTDPVADYSTSETGFTSTFCGKSLRNMKDSYDLSKILKIVETVGTSREVHMFNKLKLTVNPEHKYNVNFKHLELGRHKPKKSVVVMYKGEALNFINNYGRVKGREEVYSNFKKEREEFLKNAVQWVD